MVIAEGMARLSRYLTMNHDLNWRSQAVTFRSFSHEENQLTSRRNLDLLTPNSNVAGHV